MVFLTMGLLCGVTAPFVLAIWAAFMHRHLMPLGPSPIGTPAGGLPREGKGDDAEIPHAVSLGPDSAEHATDLATLVRDVVARVEPMARERFVRTSLAIPIGLTAGGDNGALRTALRETLLTAIHASAGGHVLISARVLGTQLHVIVTDDDVRAHQAMRETLARETGGRIALRGGSVLVEAFPGQGTTVTIRLPLSGSAGSHDSGTTPPGVSLTVSPREGHKQDAILTG